MTAKIVPFPPLSIEIRPGGESDEARARLAGFAERAAGEAARDELMRLADEYALRLATDAYIQAGGRAKR
jgi:hypothetical protein